MKKLTGLSISEVRKRVRQHLIAEANDKVNTRNRGVGSSGMESPESVLLRFKTSLEKAVPGDVFWLTYGIAEHKQLSDNDREQMGASSTDLRFSTEIYDSMVNMLMGKHKTKSDDEINQMPAEDKEEAKTLQNSTSSFASSKRLLDKGLEVIKSIQKERISILSNFANRVKSRNAPNANLVDELKKIIVLSADIEKSLRSADQSARKSAIDMLRESMGRGEIKLTAKYIESENLLISAAEMIAYGNKLHTLSVDQTGIPGTRRRKDDAILAQEKGNANTIKKDLTGVGKQLKDGKSELGDKYDANSDVIDILIGACISLLTFDGPKIKITAGSAHNRLERSGLPMPVLQSIVSLLLWEITYGAEKLSNYMSDPKIAGSFLLWAEHLDPMHTVEIAKGFIGDGDLAYDTSDSGKSLRPGLRTLSHWDPQTDAIINAALRVVPGADPDTITDEQIGQIISSLGSLGIEVTPVRVKKILQGRKFVAIEKSTLANLSDPNSRADYQKRRKTSPADLAKEVASRAVFNESEKRIYHDILRRMLFGATIRCVGKDIETKISSAKQTEAEKKLNLQGASARIDTQRTFPIFEARIERPKQTYIKTVQDTETLGAMTAAASHLGLTDFKIFKGGGSPLESASAKLGSAGEATVTSGKPAQHRSEILTPNVRIKLSDKALEEAIKNGNVAKLLGADTSYAVSKPFKIPYIEKITTDQKNMTVEDIMSLEKVYDKKLKPLKVTVQLLGAKKFHDDDHKRKTVSKSYLKPIPEMGIIPVGLDLPDDVRLSETTKQRIKSQVAPAAVALLKNESGIDSNPEKFESFDLRDRLIKDPNAQGYGTLTNEIERMIKKLRYEIRAESNLGVAEHKKSVERQMLRFLQSSHSTSADVLDSRVSAQMIKNALDTLLIKAEDISSRSVRFNNNNIKDIKAIINSSSTTSANGFGGLLQGERINDPQADQALRLASTGLYIEVGSESNEIKLDKVPALSFAINAALSISMEVGEEQRPATSENIKAAVEERSNRLKADPASGFGMYPKAIPLAKAFVLAEQSAKSLIQDFQNLKIEEVLNRITKTHMSNKLASIDIEEDEENPSEIGLAGLGEQLEDLSGKVADLRSEGMRDAKALNDLIKGIESLATDLSSTSIAGRLSGNVLLPPMSGWTRASFTKSTLASLISLIDKNTTVTDNEINGYLTRLKTIMSEDAIYAAKSLATSLRDTVISASSLREDLVTTLEESRSSGYHGTSKEEQDNNTTLQMINKLQGVLNSMKDGMDNVVKSVQEIESVVSQSDTSKSLANTVLDVSEIASIIGDNQVDDLVKSVIDLSESLVGEEDDIKSSIVGTAASILISSVGSSNLAKSLGNISFKKATRSMQDPVAVETAYKEKEKMSGLTEDQSLLFKSLIQKTSVGGMAKMTDPYEVAKTIIIGTAKNASDEISKLRMHLLNAFFPFVELSTANKLVDSNSGEALTNRNYEITIAARANSIVAALNSARALKKAAIEGDANALQKLRDLNAFFEQVNITEEIAPESDFTQVTQSDKRGVTSQAIEKLSDENINQGRIGDPSRALASAVPTRRFSISPEVKIQQGIAKAAAQKQSVPAIRADSTGTSSVDVDNIATYMSAAASVSTADNMGANVTIMSASGEEIPLSDASLDDAIDAISSKESKVTNPDGADLVAIQTALVSAKSVIDKINTIQGKLSNKNTLPISLASDYIRSIMKKRFPDTKK